MFIRMEQCDRKFLADKSKILSHEYAEMCMIVVKKARVPPRTEFAEATVEYAYMEGMQGKKGAMSLRLVNIRSGDFYILYRVSFDEQEHQCKKINFIIQGTS